MEPKIERGALVQVGPAYRMGGRYAPDEYTGGPYTVLRVTRDGLDAELVRGDVRADLPRAGEGDVYIAIGRCTVLATATGAPPSDDDRDTLACAEHAAELGEDATVRALAGEGYTGDLRAYVRACVERWRQHTDDAHCTVGPDDFCTGCGVHHGDPCGVCGGRGFHVEGCSEIG